MFFRAVSSSAADITFLSTFSSTGNRLGRSALIAAIRSLIARRRTALAAVGTGISGSSALSRSAMNR